MGLNITHIIANNGMFNFAKFLSYPISAGIPDVAPLPWGYEPAFDMLP